MDIKNKARVLVLEDDYISKFIWDQILKYTFPNSEVDYVSNVKDGKEVLIKNFSLVYDFIIIDIFLSGDETGIDFLEFIELNKNSIKINKILIVSGIEEINLRNYLQNNSINLPYIFIPKPVRYNDYISFLKKESII